MNKQDITTREEAEKYMKDINARLAEVESMEDDFLSRDLEFLALACREEKEKLYGLVVNPDDYSKAADLDNEQTNEGENSPLFNQYFQESNFHQCAEMVKDIVLEHLDLTGVPGAVVSDLIHSISVGVRVRLAHMKGRV